MWESLQPFDKVEAGITMRIIPELIKDLNSGVQIPNWVKSFHQSYVLFKDKGRSMKHKKMSINELLTVC